MTATDLATKQLAIALQGQYERCREIGELKQAFLRGINLEK